MKKIITIIIVILLIGTVFYFVRPTNNKNASLVSCLKESGVVIYGSPTCPACAAFVDQFGGHDVIDPIYIECGADDDRCYNEIKTGYVPEIQINGEVYSGPRSPQDLANLVRCKY